jgi:hypothetical protein
MNTINIENNNNAIIITKNTIIKFVCIMYIIYICIYLINYKRVNAYFAKKVQENAEDEEEEELTLIRPAPEEEPVEDASVAEVANEAVLSANEIVAEPVLSKAENLEAVVNLETVASSSVAEEKDVNTWYKFEDGKGRYKGEWKNGLPNGKGTKHSYKDDSYIYGNFVDGFSEGYGKQTFEQTWEKTQPYYEGEFKRNNYHGKGEYHYGDGDYYKGDWKDSKYHGHGAAYSKRLDKTWVGEYENDVKGEGNWVKGEI